MKKLFLPLFLFFSLLLLFIIGKPQQTVQAQTTTIVIKDYLFSPQTVTIKVGSSVTWRNDDNTVHTATSDTGAWDSSNLNTGQTYTKTFSTPGTYTYHCAKHSNMTGTIVVTAATPTTVSSPTPTPPQNISPTFACLGSCPTPTQLPQSPTPTSHPTSTVTPTPENPCIVAEMKGNTMDDMQAMHRGGKRGGDRGYKGGGGGQGQGGGSSNNGFLAFFLILIQLLLQLLGLGNGTLPPAPSLTPVPSYVPTPAITLVEEPTHGPSPTPCPLSPTPTGTISIDDLKYTPGTEALRKFDLIAEPISATQWTFNSDLSQNKTPGPEWRVVQGDHMRINFVNHLSEPTAIHWHGVRAFASQDGIPGITQNSVPPGGSYQYDFIVPDAGTYWYHPHQNQEEQITRGLMGAIIVEPRIPTANDAFQRDHTIFYNNTVKSSTNTQLQGLPGERVRLRLINGRESDFSGAPLRIALVGAPFKVFALDGQAINEPQQISDQLIELAMGNRVDLEFTMPASGSVKLIDSQNLQNFTIGQGADPTIPNLNTLPTFSYLNYGVATADPRLPKTTFDAEYTLNLGGDLSINGKLFPNVPDMVVKKGQLTKITYINNSTLTHPMHIHGQFYSVLKVNGTPVTGSPIHLDTVIVKPGETVEVAVLADNEGIWMLHCHVLAHAAGGMMMFNSYDNVYSPYRFGSGTGNDPH